MDIHKKCINNLNGSEPLVYKVANLFQRSSESLTQVQLGVPSSREQQNDITHTLTYSLTGMYVCIYIHVQVCMYAYMCTRCLPKGEREVHRSGRRVGYGVRGTPPSDNGEASFLLIDTDILLKSKTGLPRGTTLMG